MQGSEHESVCSLRVFRAVTLGGPLEEALPPIPVALILPEEADSAPSPPLPRAQDEPLPAEPNPWTPGRHFSAPSELGPSSPTRTGLPGPRGPAPRGLGLVSRGKQGTWH